MDYIQVGGNTTKDYSYDAAGRTTSVAVTGVGTTTLAYDYEGRVTTITYPSTATNTFTYNGLDTRVSKVDSTGTRTYLRDGAGVTAPVLSDGAASYTPGISEKRSGTTTYTHAGFKNGESQTGSGQTVLATKTFDAFGNLDTSSGTWKGPFGYGGPHGYQSDPDSGLMLLGHRYYDSSTGRFLTRDPVKDGRNWYVYCDNNPLSYADSDGLKKMVIVIGSPYKDGESNRDGAHEYFDDLGSKYESKYKEGGWDVIVLTNPTEKELSNELKDAEGLIFIGHGNESNNYGRMNGNPRERAKEKLSPGLIRKAKGGKKLDVLILESCNLCLGTNDDEWLRVAEVVYGYPGPMYPGRRLRDWGRKGGYGPKVFRGPIRKR